MYIAVRRYQALNGSEDEVMKQVEQEFVPLLRQLPGFLAYYATFASGDVVTVSVFNDASSAQESVRLAAAWVDRNPIMKTAVSEPPKVWAGEVAVHATAATAAPKK
jgi:hypothetical protein